MEEMKANKTQLRIFIVVYFLFRLIGFIFYSVCHNVTVTKSDGLFSIQQKQKFTSKSF